MRIWIASSAMALLIAQGVLAQDSPWTPQVSSSPGALYVVDAVSDEVAWAAGNDAIVVRTVNGGAEWEPCPTPYGAHWALGAVDDQTCVVSGWPAVLWRTTDGGQTWNVVHDAGDSFINAVHFFDSQRGWAMGDPVQPSGDRFVILETTDGGATWVESPSAPPATYPEHGLTGSFAWVGDQLGAFGVWEHVIWRTTNGGADWQSVPSSIQQVAALALGDDGMGLAGGDLGMLERTTDSGATWESIPSPTVVRVLQLVWIENDEYWGSTHQQGVFHSTNAGGDWEAHELGEPFDLVEDLDFAGSERGWAVGEHAGAGAIWRYDANPVTAIVVSPAPVTRAIWSYPNPFRSRTRFGLEGTGTEAVEIAIYDASGHRVRTLGPARLERDGLEWDGRDGAGRSVPGGVYFYRTTGSDGESLTGSLIRVR